MEKGEEDSCENLIKYASGSHNSSFECQEPSECYSWVQNRILIDLKEIQNDLMLKIQVDLAEDSIYNWDITFPAPNGKLVEARLHFGSEYPYIPPRVTIKQRLFHPNISKRGEVCLQYLKSTWTPAHTVWSLILSVQSLLSDPNPDDPANAHAANLLVHSPDEYQKRALECFEMLNFFSYKGEDCEKTKEKNCSKTVESKDYQKLCDKASIQNVEVKKDDSLELNDETIAEFEEEMWIQSILHDTFLNGK